MTQPVRIGVVGVGNFGQLHAATLAGLAEAELVALVDSDVARLTQMTIRLPQIPTWTDLDKALAEANAEAWIIATRTESHIDCAAKILSEGGFVLIEKPLAESVAEANRLQALIDQMPSRVMLGHILLFASEIRQLQHEVQQREPLIYLQLERHRPNTTWDYYQENPFRLLMIHDLYLTYALMQGRQPEHITGRLHPRRGGGFDLARAELEWADGTWASLTASYLTPPGMGAEGFDRVQIFGKDWSSRLHLNPRPLEIWAEQAEWPLALDIYVDPMAPSGWLAEELRHFCRVVRGQSDIPVGARYQDGLCVQKWLEQLEMSAQNAR